GERASRRRPAPPARAPPPGRAGPAAPRRPAAGRVEFVSGALPLVEDLAPLPDPVAACRCFADLPFLLFLDSATDPDQLGRHSFLAADPATVVRSKNILTQQRSPAGEWIRVAGDPLTRMRPLLAPHHVETVPDLPPFHGRTAGYSAYDLAAKLHRSPPPTCARPSGWGCATTSRVRPTSTRSRAPSSTSTPATSSRRTCRSGSRRSCGSRRSSCTRGCGA